MHGTSQRRHTGKVGLLDALRRERLGYVVLVCLSLALQGFFPSIAVAAYASFGWALPLTLCATGGGAEGSGLDKGAALCVCVAGTCSMSCCTGAPPSAATRLDPARSDHALHGKSRNPLRPAHLVPAGPIRGPPSASVQQS